MSHWHFWRIVKAVVCFTHQHFCPQSILHCTVIGSWCCRSQFFDRCTLFFSVITLLCSWTVDTLIISSGFCTTSSSFFEPHLSIPTHRMASSLTVKIDNLWYRRLIIELKRIQRQTGRTPNTKVHTPEILPRIHMQCYITGYYINISVNAQYTIL